MTEFKAHMHYEEMMNSDIVLKSKMEEVERRHPEELGVYNTEKRYRNMSMQEAVKIANEPTGKKTTFEKLLNSQVRITALGIDPDVGRIHLLKSMHQSRNMPPHGGRDMHQIVPTVGALDYLAPQLQGSEESTSSQEMHRRQQRRRLQAMG